MLKSSRKNSSGGRDFLIFDADNVPTAPLPLYSGNRTVLCYKKGIFGNYGPFYERITGQKPLR